MNLECVLFFLVALLALVSATLATHARDPRIASRGRVAFLLSLAPLYAQLGAPYLGLLQLAVAVIVGWRTRPSEARDEPSASPWLPGVGLAGVGLLAAALWWSTYRDFPRRPPRGDLATVWQRPQDLLEPLSLVLVLVILVTAVGWAIRSPEKGNSA